MSQHKSVGLQSEEEFLKYSKGEISFRGLLPRAEPKRNVGFRLVLSAILYVLRISFKFPLE